MSRLYAEGSTFSPQLESRVRERQQATYNSTRKDNRVDAKDKRGVWVFGRDHASSPNDNNFLSVFFGFFFGGFELLSLTISPNEARSSPCNCNSPTAFRFFFAPDPVVLGPADEKFKLFEFVAFVFVVVGAGSTFGTLEGSGRGGRPWATHTPGSAIAGLLVVGTHLSVSHSALPSPLNASPPLTQRPVASHRRRPRPHFQGHPSVVPG